MPQVVFAVLVPLDIFPFEVAAAAAVGYDGLAYCTIYGGEQLALKRTYRLPSLRTPATRSILRGWWDMRSWVESWNRQQLERGVLSTCEIRDWGTRDAPPYFARCQGFNFALPNS